MTPFSVPVFNDWKSDSIVSCAPHHSYWRASASIACRDLTNRQEPGRQDSNPRTWELELSGHLLQSDDFQQCGAIKRDMQESSRDNTLTNIIIPASHVLRLGRSRYAVLLPGDVSRRVTQAIRNLEMAFRKT